LNTLLDSWRGLLGEPRHTRVAGEGFLGHYARRSRQMPGHQDEIARVMMAAPTGLLDPLAHVNLDLRSKPLSRRRKMD
jgi:hypothetical protein